MFRRVVSFLVVVGLFASQLAAMPHAHEEMSPDEQQKHDATPHVHLAGHGKHCHSHSHSHGHCHCHHSAKTEQSSKPSERPAGDGFNHDEGAVYLGEAGKLTITSSGSAAAPMTIADLPTSVASSIYGFMAAAVPALPWHPPDKVVDDSEAYLTLRTLRI